MAMSLEKSKKLNVVNKLFHPSANPEILVNIGPLDSEQRRLKSRPLKNIIKKKHWQSV